MRIEKSIKNAKIAALMTIVTIAIGFIAQRVFIRILGSEYLGLNGLFSNILSILSIVELGFSNAIIFNLYKPVAERNEAKISALLLYYKKIYRIVASTVFILGIMIMPFLPFFIGNTSTITENIYCLFLLALLDIVMSYVMAYRRSVLYADQSAYVVNLAHTGYILAMNTLQITMLLLTHNFVIYLVIKVVCRIAENLVVNEIVKHRYPFLRKINNVKIDTETKDAIKKQMHGLIYHKIASAAVLSTDNLIISRLFGIVTVGIYSGYYMIISATNEFLSQVFLSITGSIGNLLVENDAEKSHRVYKSMLLINSWSYTFAASGILCAIQPFIKIWLGEDYLLPTSIVFVLMLNFYMQGMRKTNARFKEAAGIYYEDRFIPVVEAFVNLVSSVILGKIFGMVGVFMGTILSSLVLFFYSYPVYVYKKILRQKYINFILVHFKYLIISSVCISIAYLCTALTGIYIKNDISLIVIAGLYSAFIPNIVYYLLFRKTEEFEYIRNNILSKIRRRRGARK